MKRTAVALIALVLAAATADAKDLVIRNATVLTITGGTLENGTVWIRDGKIAGVGSSISTPAGAEVIDATGKFVMPGIIDAHSHTAVVGSVNEGSLTNSGMVRVTDALTNEDISSYRQLAGGTTAANVLHGSANAIGGQNAVVKWKWGRPVAEWVIADAPAGIKFALGENPKSANWSEGTTRPYPATRMGVEEVVREAFTKARDYRAAQAEVEAKRKRGEAAIPVRRDLLLEEMAAILEGKVLVHSHCYRSDEILMLMRLAEEMGFKVATFQHVLEGYRVAPEMAKHGAGGSTFIDWWGFKMEAYDATPYNVAMMMGDGVLTSVNSDSDELARRLNLDAAKAIRYGGISEEEALRLVTINPAIQLGIDHRLGSIEKGKDGDVVIWSGHPLSVYSRVETAIIEGEVYFDRQRDLAMREALKKEKEELLRLEKEAEAGEKKAKAEVSR